MCVVHSAEGRAEQAAAALLAGEEGGPGVAQVPARAQAHRGGVGGIPARAQAELQGQVRTDARGTGTHLLLWVNPSMRQR